MAAWGGGGTSSGDSGRGQGGSGAVLNPSRPRGFNERTAQSRLETPTLSEMRLRQKAIVARFMTFFQRKNSLVIEMYETAFFRQKPTMDKIADFVYTDLCNAPDLRKEVKDVQFHPVKMLIFIKFSEEKWRDAVMARVQSPGGVRWSGYGVRVKGYSLDAQVKFIRVLGVSPETEEDEIKETFQELGLGEVVEIKKGFLDAARLPGVTNGQWSVRLKIADQDKVIPSYIHRRDEGELWSLNFEGRVFCCWKCGSGNHIGDKCPEQARTFDEIFNGSASDDNFQEPTWAVVVRRGIGESEEEKQKQSEIELKLKDENKKRIKEKNEQEEKRRLQEAETERQVKELEEKKAMEKRKAEEDKERDALLRKKALDDVYKDAQTKINSGIADDSTFGGNQTDSLIEKAGEVVEDDSKTDENLAQCQDRALLIAVKHKSWVEERERHALQDDRKIARAEADIGDFDEQDFEFDRIFGAGAAQEVAQLEIEFQDKEGVTVGDGMITSTPKRRRQGGRRRNKAGSSVREVSEDDSEVSKSGIENLDPDCNDNKKFKLDADEGTSEEDEEEASATKDENIHSEEEGNQPVEGEDKDDGTTEVEEETSATEVEIEGDQQAEGVVQVEVYEQVERDMHVEVGLVEELQVDDTGLGLDGNVVGDIVQRVNRQLDDKVGDHGDDQAMDGQGGEGHRQSRGSLAGDIGLDSLATGKEGSFSQGEEATAGVTLMDSVPGSPSIGESEEG